MSKRELVDPSRAVKWFLRELNSYLRPFGFHRRGQTFGRVYGTCWQVMNVQLSRFSASDEKSLTINFGVHTKTMMSFRTEDLSKLPHHYDCPIRFRIGWLMDSRD